MQRNNKRSNEDQEREITRTKDCYELVKSENVNKKTDYMRVSQVTNISKISFQIIKKAEEDREKQVEVVAMGQTIVKLIKIVEFIKKNVFGINIAYKIGGIPFEETFKPLYQGLNEVKIINNKPAMFAVFTYNEKLVKNEPGFQVAEPVDKEKSKSLVERAKTYSYGKINENQNRKFSNKGYREEKEQTKEKPQETTQTEKKVNEVNPKKVEGEEKTNDQPRKYRNNKP